MLCPKCGNELQEGSLYCDKCGEDIHIVPDYDPTIDSNIDNALEQIGNVIEKDYEKKNADTASVTEMDLSQTSEGSVKRFRFMVGGLALLAVFTVALIGVTIMTVGRYNSLDYQLEHAASYRYLGDYTKSIACYTRALELDEDNLSIVESLGEIYYLQNDQIRFEECLNRILSSEQATQEQIHEAYSEKIVLLIKKGNFTEICRILTESQDPELLEKYAGYLAPVPELSLPDGTYEGIQSLRISASGEGTIYYTMDGTVPGALSTTYTLPVILDFGDVTVKACLINEYGVKSEIVTGTYKINRPIETPQ